MYLKSIEVQGFKSFANKLKFEFREGITGIVGPNGSGKSNVADAVRWVLGEQSARQLRSGTMQDVIFAGTQMRKPQSFASVAITFDNSDHRLDVDYEEVTVTRKLYRSGESEYLLNNTQVRLRDINEIFYDTGIGQEGYSIIGQGQIDRILSGKSEERRELFDEAAGIVKFKKRKNTALKKLAEEHQNLLRVTDIRNELQSRLGPLKAQSDAAKVFLEKRSQLRDLDVSLFLAEDDRFELQSGELRNKIDICQSDMTGAKEEFDRTRREYEKIEEQLTEIDASMEALSEEQAKIAVRRTDLSGQIDVIREQINTIDASSGQMSERRGQIGRDIAERKEELGRSEERLSSLRDKSAEAEKDAAAKEEALAGTDEAISRVTEEIERTRSGVMSLIQERSKVREKDQRYKAMLEQMEIRRSGLTGRLLQTEENLRTAKEASDTQEEAFRGISEKLEASKRAQAEAETALRGTQDEMKRLNQELDAATETFHRDSSKLESLRGMAERYEGYGGGIRKIMEQKARNSGIRGVVADLLEVDKKYETAVETALGGSLRNVVTDNEATAKYLIEYLKTNKLGRVTFLPITSMRPRELQDRKVLSEQGVIGTAASLVKTEEEFRPVADHLLGRVVVVDHIDHAIAIGRKYRHSVFMVTLQGESFSPGGAITGGSFRNSDNLLGRKREIEELTEGTKNGERKIRSLRGKLEEARERRNALRDRLSAESEREQQLQLDLKTAELTRRQAEETLRESRKASASISEEKEKIEEQIAEIGSRRSEIHLSIEETESGETEMNERAASLREEEARLHAKRAETAAALEGARLEAARWREQLSFREETSARLRREIAALESEEGELSSKVEDGGRLREEKENQILQVKDAIERSLKAEEEHAAKRNELAARKRELSDNNKEFFARREALSELMSRLDKEYFHLTTQKEKLETDREERTNYMFDEYNLTPSEIRKLPRPESAGERSTVKRRISALKSEIRGLGNVNVNAIEEYKELEERFTFLDGQHQDLLKSEDTLTKIITELDEGMRRQFSEKMAEIRVEFDRAFKELFGGGSGSIELDPEADILEAAITIIAHPPGKKLQNMLQLSGGEKALTAIALLFAIQNLKPSPFCLLDEIEAALDESNVTRFAEYLHNLTKNTQFIVITHRRGTMAAADRLYGITMQEKGVSALVSVNLVEDELK